MNREEIKQILKTSYNITADSINIGPRQFVAETFIVTTKEVNYFVKVISKDLFKSQILKSLPFLAKFNSLNIKSVADPIKTIDELLFVEIEDELFILFEYIQGEQTEEYDLYKFGEVIADIHLKTLGQKGELIFDDFSFQYEDYYKKAIDQLLSIETQDPILKKLKEKIFEHKNKLSFRFNRFKDLESLISSSSRDRCYTHGDAGGNTIRQIDGSLIIIDWDEILLSYPERDIWVNADSEQFMKGYRNVFQNVEISDEFLEYFMLRYYFDSFTQYLKDVLDLSNVNERLNSLNELIGRLEDCWMTKYLKKYKVY